MGQPDEFRCFAYHDGNGAAFADPLRVHRKLWAAAGGKLGELVKLAAGPDEQEAVPDSAFQALGADASAAEREFVAKQFRAGQRQASDEAEDRLLSVIRDAFQLQPFDPKTGAGATEDECWKSFWDFQEFLEKKRASAGNSPTPPASTAPASCPTP